MLQGRENENDGDSLFFFLTQKGKRLPPLLILRVVRCVLFLVAICKISHFNSIKQTEFLHLINF